MDIKIYNTLTRQKDNFIPLKDKFVSMYVCGPTVYSDCHIGHIMGPVLFDAIARWFKLMGYKVNFVNNITDIDDKIIKKSLESGEDWQVITQHYTQQYFDLLKKLKVISINHFPKCTQHINAMVKYIQVLFDKGYAYTVSNNGVYYTIKNNASYGKLSGRKLEDMLENNRVAYDTSLKNPHDFCLWKFCKEDEPSWDSPWGAGRPGWHLECSVMSNSLLGDTFDIHGGGDDLKFPHHENEIAQGEAFGGSYAHYWMHNGLIEYEGKKIGKSDPRMQDKNFSLQFDANYLVKTYGADVIRFFILRGHYRRPFDFAPKELEATKKALHKIKKAFRENNISTHINSLDEAKELAEICQQRQSYDKICQAMNDDFNTGAVIAEIFYLIKLSKKDENKCFEILTFCHALLSLLGIELDLSMENNTNDNELINILIELREEARESKDWSLSDKIRDKLASIGILLEDNQEGCQWRKKDD